LAMLSTGLLDHEQFMTSSNRLGITFQSYFFTGIQLQHFRQVLGPSDSPIYPTFLHAIGCQLAPVALHGP
jgi:hypothetical protein